MVDNFQLELISHSCYFNS